MEPNKLNKHLQPINSPVDTKGTIQTGVQFSIGHKRNAITGTRIRDFNFSQGHGGTLTLGGTANGAGQLLIENTSGSVIVLGDSNGLAVYGGSISIQNTSGQNAIDAMGIVSNSNNFVQTQQVIAALNQVVSGTNIVDITSSTMTPFVLTRPTTLQFIYTAYAYLQENIGTDTGNGQIYFNYDGNVIGYADVLINSGADFLAPWTTFRIFQLGAGTHTFKLQAALTGVSGTPNMTVAAFRESYILYGT